MSNMQNRVMLSGLCTLMLTFTLSTPVPSQAPASSPSANNWPIGTGERYVLSYSFPTKVGATPEVFAPKGVALDAQDNIYVTGSQRGAEEYSPTGSWLRTFGASKPLGGVADTAGGKLYTPFGIAVDSAGSVYITDDLTQSIQKFQRDGTYLNTITVPTKTDGQPPLLIGIAVDAAGTIFAVDSTSQSVLQFQPDGKPGAAIGSPGKGEGQFSLPRFMAIDLDHVNIVDSRNFRVQVFRSSGKFIRAFGTSGFNNGQFQTADGIGVDGNHNIYVADGTRIEKFAYNGTFLTKIEIPTVITKDPGFNGHTHYSTTLSGVQGIAVDKRGTVFVADTNNNRICVFQSTR